MYVCVYIYICTYYTLLIHQKTYTVSPWYYKSYKGITRMVIQSMKNHLKIPNHGSIALVVSSITSNPQPLPFGAYILIVAGSKSIFVCRPCHLFAVWELYQVDLAASVSSYIHTEVLDFARDAGSKWLVQKNGWFHTKHPHVCGSIHIVSHVWPPSRCKASQFPAWRCQAWKLWVR